MTTILLPCIVQLDYNDNLLETIVSLLDFFSLDLWRILSAGLGWSSHTEKYTLSSFLELLSFERARWGVMLNEKKLLIIS